MMWQVENDTCKQQQGVVTQPELSEDEGHNNEIKHTDIDMGHANKC